MIPSLRDYLLVHQDRRRVEAGKYGHVAIPRLGITIETGELHQKVEGLE